MHILFVDDEGSAHTNFQYCTKNFPGIHHVQYCFDYDSAIDYAKLNSVDCAFLDVSLPGKNGIALAQDLRALQPDIEFAFVTGYDEYAREAYRAGGRAYLTKPYDQEELEQVLSLMKKLTRPTKNIDAPDLSLKSEIFAKTFGAFDLMIDGTPVHFKNAKAKELLAYLIHQMGGTASNAQIFFALWERQEYTRSTSTYVRRTVRALKEELEELGIGDILISQRNCISVASKKISCDAYELLGGNPAAIPIYNGQYMNQYSWGEDTIPMLNRISNKMRTQ